MPYASSSDIVAPALCFILVLFSTVDVGGVSLAPNKTAFPALLAFGDSILDTGNNNNLFTLTKCNFPPYGRDFPGGTATGRFGNGRVFSDLLAEGLGIKSQLPAYLSSDPQSKDLESGVCFASGGSGYDIITVRLQNVLSVTDQLNNFKQYVRDLEGAVGQEKANAIISNSLILVSMGNNDLAITYSMFHLLRDIDAYATQLVNSASSFIKDLHELGARKFAHLSTLPLAHLPSARTLAGGFLRVPAYWLDQAVVNFNSKLEAELNSRITDLPGTRMVFIDVYNPLLDLIQNPNKYGFDDSTRGCCGTGLIEQELSCNVFNPFTCWDSSTHVFWDSAHPSEKAYKIIISQVIHNISQQLLDM